MNPLLCWCVSIVLLIVSLPNLGHTADNLLVNGGDSWVKGWKPGLGCHLDTKSGHELLRQTLPENFEKGNHAWHRTIPVISGARYRFQVQYRLRDVSESIVQFHFSDATGALMDWNKFRLSSAKLMGTQEEWCPLNYEFTVPSEAKAVRISLRLNSSGDVQWDAASLERIDQAVGTP